MLNKKMNDIIFIAMVVIVAAVIVFIRFTVLGQIDDRIERNETDNARLIEQILVIQNLVQENRQDQLPSMIEMFDRVPESFDFDELTYYIEGSLVISGIPIQGENAASVTINSNPALPAQGTPHRALSNQLTLHEVRIEMTLTSIDTLYALLDELLYENPMMLIRDIQFETELGSTDIPIVLNLYALYYD